MGEGSDEVVDILAEARLDVVYCARVLDRGLAQDVLREPASPTARDISRRRLATATTALLRAAIVPDDRNLPEGWPEAVLTATQRREPGNMTAPYWTGTSQDGGLS